MSRAIITDAFCAQMLPDSGTVGIGFTAVVKDGVYGEVMRDISGPGFEAFIIDKYNKMWLDGRFKFGGKYLSEIPKIQPGDILIILDSISRLGVVKMWIGRTA